MESFIKAFRGFGENFMRGSLAYVLVMAFCVALWRLTLQAVPPENEQIITYMIGQLSGMAIMALGFYFVTSKSSREKNETIRSLMDDARREPDTFAPPYVPTAFASSGDETKEPEYEHIK